MLIDGEMPKSMFNSINNRWIGESWRRLTIGREKILWNAEVMPVASLKGT